MIRRCPEHGYFDGDGCDCGKEGDAVLDEDGRLRLSKFVSGAARHFPGDAGIKIDDNGWTHYDGLAEAVVSRYDWARPEHLEAVLEPEGTFRVFRKTGTRLLRALRRRGTR